MWKKQSMAKILTLTFFISNIVFKVPNKERIPHKRRHTRRALAKAFVTETKPRVYVGYLASGRTASWPLSSSRSSALSTTATLGNSRRPPCCCSFRPSQPNGSRAATTRPLELPHNSNTQAVRVHGFPNLRVPLTSCTWVCLPWTGLVRSPSWICSSRLHPDFYACTPFAQTPPGTCPCGPWSHDPTEQVPNPRTLPQVSLWICSCRPP